MDPQVLKELMVRALRALRTGYLILGVTLVFLVVAEALAGIWLRRTRSDPTDRLVPLIEAGDDRCDHDRRDGPPEPPSRLLRTSQRAERARSSGPSSSSS